MVGMTPGPEAGPEKRSEPSSGTEPIAGRADRLGGLIIVSVVFVLSLGIAAWSQRQARGPASLPPGPPTTQGVVGWQNAVNPVETLNAARSLTQRSLLRGFIARGVRSDGTIDMRVGTGHVRYSFQSPPGKGPQPDSEGHRATRWRFCGEQSVELNQRGLRAEPDRSGVLCPPVHIEPLPDPRCTMRDIWKQAMARGAASSATAQIEYYRAQAGPAWRFGIAGTQHGFSVYGDCERLLLGAEAAGSVP